jgi:hypothetical protein
MLLASVNPGSSPASEAVIASAVHLFSRAAASGEGCPQSSTSKSICRSSTAALIMTRRYAWAESKPSCFAFAVNLLRTAGSRGIWIVDVSLIITIGYQRYIIVSIRRCLQCQQRGLEPHETELRLDENKKGARYLIWGPLVLVLVGLEGLEPPTS